MKVEGELSHLINKINDGVFDQYAAQLGDTDLGLYIPSYVDGDMVKTLPQGFSQTEANLRVSVERKSANSPPDDAQVVAWMGGLTSKDSKCRHGGTASCKHCTGHTGNCKHCTGHKALVGGDLGISSPELDLDAPELDYDASVNILDTKLDILNSLAKEGFGLALLHGHNDKFKFTQLPKEYITVISNGVTHFRTIEEVSKDNTFVPNIWRFVDGTLLPAGGFSKI